MPDHLSFARDFDIIAWLDGAFDMVDPLLKEALDQLPRVVVFAEIARRGSFRAAAEALDLSPSTVSHHLKVLEASLNVSLMERTSRAITLTAAGRALLVDAQDLLNAWKRGTAGARSHSETPMGTLVLTCPDVVAERFAVPAIERLVTEYPQVTVDLRVSPKNLDLVAEGIDVAIRRGPLDDSGYGAFRLYRDHYGVFAAPELAAEWATDDPRSLDDAPWVRFAVRARHPALTGPNEVEVTVDGVTRVVASSARTFIDLILGGVGFGLVPRVLVAPDVHSGRLVHVTPQWTSGIADFYVVTPSPRPKDLKVVRFIEALRAIAPPEPSA